jgi:hypothetical protein
MNNFEEGSVVIVSTGQAGTIVDKGKDICVLLCNGDLWFGFETQIRTPQDPEDLAACPLDVDRFEGR